MAFLQLKSTNPNFSRVIMKNPETKMVVKSLRQGKLFGYFSKDDTQTYNCLFRDAQGEVSYKSHPDESFEYINTSRYNSAMFVINTISDLFRTAAIKEQELDKIGFTNIFTLNMLYIKNTKYVEIFNTHFPKFNIEAEEVAARNYKLTVQTELTIRELLNYINLFVVFNSLKNGDYFVIEEKMIEKYINCLTVIDAPYFIRYVFKVNFLRGPTAFKQFLPIIKDSKQETINTMNFGSTTMMRRTAIQDSIDNTKSIIDIGCGEGFYGIGLAKRIAPLPYIAIDISEDKLERFKRKAALKKLDNVHTYASFDDFLAQQENHNVDKFDIIMSEVIEHMPVEEATKLTQQVSDFHKASTIIISTPNKDFNKFYDFEEDMLRDDDHHYEFTEAEFVDWVTESVLLGDFVKSDIPTDNTLCEYTAAKSKLKFYGNGDQVNGTWTSVFCKIELGEL